MPQYKLTYFNMPGISEPIRYLFAYAGVNFEDDRVEKEDWPKIKAQKPFAKMPVLTIDDKIFLTQSVAIARYLSKKFKLTGRDDLHDAYLDSVVDNMQDLHWKLYGAIISANNPPALFLRGDSTAPTAGQSAIDSFEADVLPFYLKNFNDAASKGFLYGTEITWADLYFVGWNDTMETILKKDLLVSYPNLANIKKTVQAKASVQKYLAKRPKTTIQIYKN